MPKKGELGRFADLRGALVKKKGWCLIPQKEGIDTPLRSMAHS